MAVNNDTIYTRYLCIDRIYSCYIQRFARTNVVMIACSIDVNKHVKILLFYLVSATLKCEYFAVDTRKKGKLKLEGQNVD